jgi:hypothetical protein
MKTLINNLINLRGMREQASRFAFGHKGGQAGCFTRGCDIFTPLQFNLKGIDLQAAIALDRCHTGEVKASGDYLIYVFEELARK